MGSVGCAVSSLQARWRKTSWSTRQKIPRPKARRQPARFIRTGRNPCLLSLDYDDSTKRLTLLPGRSSDLPFPGLSFIAGIINGRLAWTMHSPPLLRLARSEEQTSELQSLMRISYVVFFLTKN